MGGGASDREESLLPSLLVSPPLPLLPLRLLPLLGQASVRTGELLQQGEVKHIVILIRCHQTCAEGRLWQDVDRLQPLHIDLSMTAIYSTTLQSVLYFLFNSKVHI